MSAEVESSDINGIHEERFVFDKWSIVSRRSHILHSKCSSSFICAKNEDNVGPQLTIDDNKALKCLFCRFVKGIDLPSLPDMTFAQNLLELSHESGFKISFSCYDALKSVDRVMNDVKVGVAQNWSEARSDCIYSQQIRRNFNWTFSTDYMGTLVDGVVSNTNERIDMEKLKLKEEIRFYDEVDLFEDELADNGVAKCSVKIRVMKESFFILLRYFLRIDNVLAKICDTRIHYEKGNNYVLRENTVKQGSLNPADKDWTVDVITDPVELSKKLPTISNLFEKIEICKT